MADSEKVSQFISITGANTETANFFLNAARNDVDAAVNAFFEADGMIPPSAHTGAGQPSSNRPMPTPSSSNRPTPSQPARSGGPASQFATLASLGGNEDEDEDESGKNYYAGGEKSGQMIQDPRGRDGGAGSSDRRMAEEILERARQNQGADDDEVRERFGDAQRFTGAGYRLGDTDAPPPSAPTVVGRRNVARTIAFYDNGFVVDDGPLRSYNDPANAAFLADVNKGVVPREMEEPGIGDVSITLLDKKGEAYTPPKRRIVPFSGGGQRLAGSNSTTTQTATTAPPAVDAAAATLEVDETQPVAVVQVRLSDGTRLRARLNEHHTVGQLRAFVQAARPGVPNFTLATTFPRKELADDAQSVKDAGLKGAVVVQTLK